MKILQITQAFGGGVFFSVSNICNGLIESGNEVTLLYSEREELPDNYQRYLSSQVKLIPVSMCTDIHPWNDLKSLVGLYKYLKKNKPDVIHLHSSKAGALGRIAARLAGYQGRTFYSPRGLAFLREDISPFKKGIYSKIERLLACFGGSIVSCSQSEMQEVRSKVKPGKSVLIENAVDMTPILEKKHIESVSPIVIGTIGRISSQKNPREFLALARDFAKFDVRFLWIGGGGDEQILKEFSDANIEVTGWITREQVLKKLTLLDIYVQTSLWEGMPLAVIEAQVAGIPTVVRDAVGNRDVVSPGENGYIAHDYGELITFVEQLIKEGGTRRTLGQNARRIALKRFSMERLLSELIPLYEAASR